MYKIIGGDQREYGPVSEEEVRHWIVEGRLNSRSRCRHDDQAEWRTLADFPEFQPSLAAHEAPPPPIPGATPPPVNAEVWTAEILAREPFVPIGSCLARSWELLRTNFGLLFKASLLLWLVKLVEMVPLLGGMTWLVVSGVLYGGLCLVFLKRIRGEPTTPSEVFSGFNLAFGQLVLAGVVVHLLSAIGLICLCIVPGLFFLVAWIFAVPLVADKRLEFWSAMELSRKVVTRVWFPVFLLLVISLLPVILLMGTTMAQVATQMPGVFGDLSRSQPQDFGHVMERIVRMNAKTMTLGFFMRLVLLFNLPFAVGALMYAYEGLFGSRSATTA